MKFGHVKAKNAAYYSTAHAQPILSYNFSSRSFYCVTLPCFIMHSFHNSLLSYFVRYGVTYFLLPFHLFFPSCFESSSVMSSFPILVCVCACVCDNFVYSFVIILSSFVLPDIFPHHLFLYYLSHLLLTLSLCIYFTNTCSLHHTHITSHT